MDFLERHDFDLVCRAHQVVDDGYKFYQDGNHRIFGDCSPRLITAVSSIIQAPSCQSPAILRPVFSC